MNAYTLTGSELATSTTILSDKELSVHLTASAGVLRSVLECYTETREAYLETRKRLTSSSSSTVSNTIPPSRRRLIRGAGSEVRSFRGSD
jgi:hypothetical protein